MGIFSQLAVTLARLFTSVLFLAGAIRNIFHWHDTETGMISVFSDWQAYVEFSADAQIALSFLISWSSFFILAATALLLTGGMLLLLGVKERLGISLLVLFLVPATILYHPFWWMDGAMYEMHAAMFLKNLAILGCLIQLFFKTAPAASHDAYDRSMQSF